MGSLKEVQFLSFEPIFWRNDKFSTSIRISQADNLFELLTSSTRKIEQTKCTLRTFPYSQNNRNECHTVYEKL